METWLGGGVGVFSAHETSHQEGMKKEECIRLRQGYGGRGMKKKAGRQFAVSSSVFIRVHRG
jgi:hypothetical protein